MTHPRQRRVGTELRKLALERTLSSDNYLCGNTQSEEQPPLSSSIFIRRDSESSSCASSTAGDVTPRNEPKAPQVSHFTPFLLTPFSFLSLSFSLSLSSLSLSLSISIILASEYTHWYISNFRVLLPHSIRSSTAPSPSLLPFPTKRQRPLTNKPKSFLVGLHQCGSFCCSLLSCYMRL